MLRLKSSTGKLPVNFYREDNKLENKGMDWLNQNDTFDSLDSLEHEFALYWIIDRVPTEGFLQNRKDTVR